MKILKSLGACAEAMKKVAKKGGNLQEVTRGDLKGNHFVAGEGDFVLFGRFVVTAALFGQALEAAGL
jgi:hypothetical protein